MRPRLMDGLPDRNRSNRRALLQNPPAQPQCQQTGSPSGSASSPPCSGRRRLAAARPRMLPRLRCSPTLQPLGERSMRLFGIMQGTAHP